MSTRPKRYEKGAVVIMFAMYTFVFMTIIALAVNVYLVGNALMQQRNAVEYVAMSVLKIAHEPAVPFDPTCLQNELSYLNCVLARAEVAGRVKVGNQRDSFYAAPGTLRMKARDSTTNPCCIPNPKLNTFCDWAPDPPPGAPDSPDSPDDGGGGGGGGNDGSTNGDFCWDSYQIENEEYAELVMGTYDGEAKFTDAARDAVKAGNFNAVKLLFKFDPTNANTNMITPLIGLFGKNMQLKFSSKALAYRTPGGSIKLAIDPTLSIGN